MKITRESNRRPARAAASEKGEKARSDIFPGGAGVFAGVPSEMSPARPLVC